MRTALQVLSQEERHQVHDRSLNVLSKTGLRVDSDRARQILGEAGAQVDQNRKRVRFPAALVEAALQAAPREFSLGARRPEWDLDMNAGECSLLPDGEAIHIHDHRSGERRPPTFQDWLEATRVCDALDEIGLYWSMLQSGRGQSTLAELMIYWPALFRNFSKHVQIDVPPTESVPWLLEILQVVFGPQELVRQQHPISCLICPQSPLVLEQVHIDAYLDLLGWDIPVAGMPMPLMGGTAPGNMISTVMQGNCETLALLCLLQAAAPGTPYIYAPALAKINPRTGMFSGGAVENGLLGAATTEMARYYGLPVIASGGGTDHFLPGIQSAYERALNMMLPVLSWPDILVGPGLLGSSMILSLEQLLIDIEIYKMSAHAHRGMPAGEDAWLDEVINRVGPAGNYLSERSTVKALRSGEWFIAELGIHDPRRFRTADGSLDLLAEAGAQIDHLLATHRPEPLPEEAERELQRLQQRAQANPATS